MSCIPSEPEPSGSRADRHRGYWLAGRLQRSLCRIVSTSRNNSNIVCVAFMSISPESGSSIQANGYLQQSLSKQPIQLGLRGPLFEVFCAAGHGTARQYGLDADGNVSPTLDGDRNPAAEGWGLAVQQDAVVAFAKEAVHGFRLARINPLEHIEPLANGSWKQSRSL